MSQETLDLHLKQLRYPLEKDPVQDLRWLCQSFGFCKEDDKDDTSFRVFKEIIDAAIEDRGVTSQDIADRCHISRGTAVYHINRLKKTGLVTKDGNYYLLRRRTLSQTLDELKHDYNKVLDGVIELASEIDEMYGLKSRQLAKK